MSGWAGLLAEFRHWRATLPVGACILLVVGMASLNAWPTLADPRVFWTMPLGQLIASMDPPVSLFLLACVCLLIGGWWSAAAYGFVALIVGWTLRPLPLDRATSEWRPWQRWVLPVRPAVFDLLQRRVKESLEYQDLDIWDKAVFFRWLIREAISVPVRAYSSDAAMNAEVANAVTSVRLSAGLLPWLPTLLMVGASEASSAGAGQVMWFSGATGFALLVLTTVVCVRSSANVLLLASSTPDQIASVSRLAVGAGRSRRERDEAVELMK